MPLKQAVEGGLNAIHKRSFFLYQPFPCYQDKDGNLSREEFAHFLHPEEVDHMKEIVVIETIEDLDKNKDGKITEDEYIGKERFIYHNGFG